MDYDAHYETLRHEADQRRKEAKEGDIESQLEGLRVAIRLALARKALKE
jgi:hypothetical protein